MFATIFMIAKIVPYLPQIILFVGFHPHSSALSPHGSKCFRAPKYSSYNHSCSRTDFTCRTTTKAKRSRLTTGGCETRACILGPLLFGAFGQAGARCPFSPQYKHRPSFILRCRSTGEIGPRTRVVVAGVFGRTETFTFVGRPAPTNVGEIR